jgi:hypothetical protein
MNSFIAILIWFSLLCAFPSVSDAQTHNEPASAGKITINQSPHIAGLIEQHASLNNKFRGYPGFRVQIYFGNGNKAKEEALRTRNSFNEQFAQYESYIVFQTPYFKVRVGDFVTRYEAYLAFQEISKKYPQAFLVEDLVNPLKK